MKKYPNCKYTAEADKQENIYSFVKLINYRSRFGLTKKCEVYETTVPDKILIDGDFLNYDALADPDTFV